MKKINLSTNEFTLIGKGLDGVGKVFLASDGQYCRGVYPHAREWLDIIQRASILEHLAERDLIPSQRVFSSATPDFCAVMVSDGCDFPIHVSQYPLLAFKEAALRWVAINKLLAAQDSRLGLIDGHYGNFAMFRRGSPKWVDIGSIATLKHPLQGMREFIRYFVLPLVIFDKFPQRSRELRARLRRPTGGLTDEEAANYGADIPNLLVGNSRPAILDHLWDFLSELSFSENRDFWSTYRKEDALMKVENGSFLRRISDTRFQAIKSLVEQLNPASIVDVGANDGLFSLLVSEQRIPVLAIDTDDHSLNKLWNFIQKANVGKMISVGCSTFDKFEQQADVVMALALTHHLILRQGASFRDVAGKLAKMTRNAVVTEFMPDGLGGTRTHPGISPNPLPTNYSLEIYLDELNSFFKHVTVINYDRNVTFSRRVLISCTDPR
jgi:hypothetical protein